MTVQTVVITGASSGIGAAFARLLAAERCALVLVSRRADRLTTLADELRAQGAAGVTPLAADLSRAHDVELVAARIEELGMLDLLINSAGFGVPGRLWEASWNRQSALARLHAEAVPRLCRAAIPGLLRAGGRGIINVASIGAWIPRPGDAVYCASKAFVVTLSIALADELDRTGLKVQALCPGFTRTEFYASPLYAGIDVALPAWLWHSAEAVARSSLRALAAGPVVHVPGIMNRLLLLAARFGGRGAILRALDRFVKARPDGRR